MTKPRLNLITVSASPRNGILNQSMRNHLVSTTEVICLIDPCLPQRKVTLSQPSTEYNSLAGITSLSCSLLPIKVFHFVQLLGAPFSLLDGIGLYLTGIDFCTNKRNIFNMPQFMF